MTDDSVMEIIKVVAEKTGIPAPVIHKAWKNQFKVVKDTMQDATKGMPESFKTIYLARLGKFVPRPTMVSQVRGKGVGNE
jgi:hypothetical protein